MHILLILEDKDARQMTAFALEAGLGAIVTRVGSDAEALQFFLEDKPFSVIVCEESEPNMKIFKYLLSVDSNAPVVLLAPKVAKEATAFPDLKILGRFEPTEPLEKLVELIQSKRDEIEGAETAEEQQYCRINTELLLKVVPLQGDVYIRLSSVKFVRLFKRGDVFDIGDLTKYFHEKKIDYLYLKRADCGEFITKFKSALANVVNSATVTPGQAFETAIAVQESIASIAQAFGFTPELQEVVRENVKLTIKAIRDNDELADLLKGLKANTSGYISTHSVILGHLSCLLATKMGWHSEMTYEKLNYAALMHDVLLKTDILARFNSRDEIEKAEPALNTAQKAEILGHPQAIADSVKKFSELPADVDTILVQHHERPDGSGFPRGLTSQRIAPLSCLFIVAHDMVHSYLKDGYGPKEFANTYTELYPSGNFKKIIEAIKTGP